MDAQKVNELSKRLATIESIIVALNKDIQTDQPQSFVMVRLGSGMMQGVPLQRKDLELIKQSQVQLFDQVTADIQKEFNQSRDTVATN